MKVTASPCPPSAPIDYSVGVLQGSPENKLVRTFRPRRRKLGVFGKAVHERLMPIWGLPDDGQEIDLMALFGNSNPVILEIGCGTGDLAVAYISAHPEINFIGVDIHTKGIANILTFIEHTASHHVRVVEGDALVFLQRLKPQSLQELWVFFPDPWHKVRHRHRRIIRTEVMPQLARVLRRGGSLRVATDVAHYAQATVNVVRASGLFTEAEMTRPDWRIATVFERRGLEHGRIAVDMDFKRQ